MGRLGEGAGAAVPSAPGELSRGEPASPSLPRTRLRPRDALAPLLVHRLGGSGLAAALAAQRRLLQGRGWASACAVGGQTRRRRGAREPPSSCRRRFGRRSGARAPCRSRCCARRPGSAGASERATGSGQASPGRGSPPALGAAAPPAGATAAARRPPSWRAGAQRWRRTGHRPARRTWPKPPRRRCPPPRWAHAHRRAGGRQRARCFRAGDPELACDAA